MSFSSPVRGRCHNVFVVGVDVRPTLDLAHGAYGLHTALCRGSFSALIFHRRHRSRLVTNRDSFYLKLISGSRFSENRALPAAGSEFQAKLHSCATVQRNNPASWT